MTEWVGWVQRLRAVAQTGLAYSENPFDRERYTALLDLAAEMAAARSGGTPEVVRDLFLRDVGPATPKVDVRAAVFRTTAAGDLEVLLVHELSDGGWSLPGGWAEVGEGPAASVVREVWEEAGYVVRPVKVVAVLDHHLHGHPPHAEHIYKIFVRCELVEASDGSTRSAIHEIDQVSFFPEGALPNLSLSRVTPAELAICFEHVRNPMRPTDFD